MKRALVAALAASLAAGTALAQAPGAEPAWLRAGREAAALTTAGNPAGALERLTALLADCPPGKEDKAACVSTLAMAAANALTALGRPAEAEQEMRKALNMRDEGFGADHPLTAEAASALGILLVQRRAYEDAAAQLERAVEILSRPLATGGRTAAQRADMLVTAYAQLAIAYRGQDRLAAAVNVTREAVDLIAQMAGPNHAATVTARINLASLLREQGKDDAAVALLLAALQPEDLPPVPRLRLAAELAQAGAASGRTDAARPAVETALALMDETDPATRAQALALLLAAGELALARSDPDGAQALAARALALLEPADPRRAAALLLQARALLDQSQPGRAAEILRAIAAPGFDASVWLVRALMDAGQLAAATESLAALRASLSARDEPPAAQAALMHRFSAMLAERQADYAGALRALEQAEALLPAPDGPQPGGTALAVTIRRELIRLRAATATEEAGRAAAIPALRALHDLQVGQGMPLPARLETKLTEAWFAAELGRTEDARTAAATVLAGIGELERQSPRSAAQMLTRLAEFTLNLPGPESAASALAYAERARLGFERMAAGGIDRGRAQVLRGNILLALERPDEAARSCAAAEESLAAIVPPGDGSRRAALTCLARAEAAQGQFGPSLLTAQRLLDATPPDRLAERVEAMRLLAAASLDLGQADAAEATLRDALARLEEAAGGPATPGRTRPGQRAEVWGDVVTALLRQGKPRDARNAAAAGRQAAGEDRAGVVTLVRILELEAQALLALASLDEAATTLDRAVALRRARLGGDTPGLAAAQAAMARLDLLRGRFEEGEAQADAAIAAQRAANPPPRRGLATALAARAALHTARGAYTAAETAQREAVALLAGGGAAMAGDTAIARLGLARLVARRGADKDAEAERDAALAQLAQATGTQAAILAAARLERLGQLRQAGRGPEMTALLAACRTAAGATAPSPPAIAAVADLAAPDRCDLMAAAMRLAAGHADAAGAAVGALQALTAHGDAGRPALAVPLTLAAAATAAADLSTADLPAALAFSERAAVMAERLPLAERAGVFLVRGAVLLRAGETAQAEGAFLAGLQALGNAPPRGLAAELAALTDGAADALLAQGKATEAAGLWRVALARSERWGGPNRLRGFLLRGLAGAERAAGRAEPARATYLDAARIDETRMRAASMGDEGDNRAAWIADIRGAALAALDGGRRGEARTLAERLLEPGTPEARQAHAALRAQLAEDADDPVTALLEYARLRALAAEAGADAATDTGADAGPAPPSWRNAAESAGDAAVLAIAGQAARAARDNPIVLALLGEARASLALGRPAAAPPLLAQARQAGIAPGSAAALAVLEITAGIAAAGTDTDAARAALLAWQEEARHQRGGGMDALRADLALAALDLSAGDAADGAARLGLALGQAARLRGRDSPLWARVALLAADAADRLGDTARADALRRAAAAVRARPDPGGAS